MPLYVLYSNAHSMPARAVAEPQGHTSCVNAIAWAPHSSCHICTAGDDAQALIWDLIDLPKKKIEGACSCARDDGAPGVRLLTLVRARARSYSRLADPILAYTADAEINQLRWSAAQSDWVSITYGKCMQVLRV